MWTLGNSLLIHKWKWPTWKEVRVCSPGPRDQSNRVGIPQFSKSKCQSKMLLEVACFKIKCTDVSSLRKKNFPEGIEAAIQANFGQWSQLSQKSLLGFSLPQSGWQSESVLVRGYRRGSGHHLEEEDEADSPQRLPWPLLPINIKQVSQRAGKNSWREVLSVQLKFALRLPNFTCKVFVRKCKYLS